ncbi:MAG TPA: TerD family protein [Abditibacterium sp.]
MKEFIRGERAKLSELAAINHLWEVSVFIDAPFWVIDFDCLGLNVDGEVFDEDFLIEYNRPEAPGGAIRLNNASNNGAIFSINLGRLPAEVRRVVFTATLASSGAPGGLLGMAMPLFGLSDNIGAGHLTLATPAYEIGEFAFSGEDFGNSDTLILGEFYFRDEWRFVAAGQPLNTEIGAFLRTLTDGPTPVPIVSAPPRAPQTTLKAPPRPPKVIAAPAPKPPVSTPIARPASPAAPVAPSRVPIPIPAPPSTIQIGAPTAPKPASAPVPVAPPTVNDYLSEWAQTLETGETLQNLVDETKPGATLALMRDEYEGPITISKPLILEGRGSAIWSRVGPVITVASAGVELRDLDVEVTFTPEKSVALRVENAGARLQLHNVQVRGQISGLGAEDGAWQLPDALHLGDFAARADNEWQFEITVPTEVELASPIEGVEVSPTNLAAGTHQIKLKVQGVAPDTLLIGQIEVRSPSLTRAIALSGNAVAGIAPASGITL